MFVLPFDVSFSAHLECSLNVQTKENKQNISILFSTTFCFVFPGEICIEDSFPIWKEKKGNDGYKEEMGAQILLI